MTEHVGEFLCGTPWGISPFHRFVHACAIRIRVGLAGQRFVVEPHDGDHVCRCGDRRAQGQTPREVPRST